MNSTRTILVNIYQLLRNDHVYSENDLLKNIKNKTTERTNQSVSKKLCSIIAIMQIKHSDHDNIIN